jgi:predicted alpha/beta hydrolase family esterase
MRILHIVGTISPAASGPTGVIRMLVRYAPPELNGSSADRVSDRNGRVHMKANRCLWLMSIVLMLFAMGSHAEMLFSRNRSASGTDPQSQFFTVNAVKIHYFVQGSGVPVVLIHAWLSSADGNWLRPGTMAQLAKDHQVIALDLAGYGESDKPDNPSAYGNAWVEQVYQLMNHLHIQKAHIVGYSMGGMVALKFIVLHPDRTLSGLLGGMGYLEEGSEQQKKWAEWSKPQWSGAAQLALTPTQIKSVNVPVEMVIGSRDPTMKNYVEPLLMVRTDWPVVEIPGKGHISAVTSQELKDDIASWLAQH